MTSAKTAKRGDLVEWTPYVGAKTRRMKVVENWSKDEPPRLLVTDDVVHDNKCNTALVEDCVLIEVHPANKE